MSYKCNRIDYLLELVVDGGVIFGSTILSSGVPVSGTAKRLMAIYNAQKTFTNVEDSYEKLEAQLATYKKAASLDGTPIKSLIESVSKRYRAFALVDRAPLGLLSNRPFRPLLTWRRQQRLEPHGKGRSGAS